MDWIVAKTKPQRESWAAENIARQDYTFYLPRFAELHIVNRQQRVLVTKPLFQGYIFVQANGRWRSLLATYFCSGVVMGAGGPALLPQRAIDEMRAREDQDGLIVLANEREAARRFAINQRVRVTDGPFSGYVGLYQGMTSKDREKILLDYLGRKVPILIAGDILEAV